MGFSLSSWLRIRRVCFPNLVIMVKSVQRGKQGDQKCLIHSGGGLETTLTHSVVTQLYVWRAARSALALDNLTSSGPFVLHQSEYNPRVGQSFSEASETAPLKTSFSEKCYCSLARAFCRFTLIFVWFQGSWEIALNKPKSWKVKCNIFFVLNQGSIFGADFQFLCSLFKNDPVIQNLDWVSWTEASSDTWDGITSGCCFTG